MKNFLQPLTQKIALKAQSLYLTHLLPLSPYFAHTAYQIGALIAAFSIFVGCGTVKTVVVEGKTEVKTHYVDSVRWDVRDSVIYIEKSVFKDYAGYLDTLRLEGSSGTVAKAWNDTSYHIITGTLEEQPRVLRETKIEYRDRLVERRDTTYIEKPIPYEVEVIKKKIPRWVWFSLGLNLITIIGIALKLYLKFKP